MDEGMVFLVLNDADVASPVVPEGVIDLWDPASPAPAFGEVVEVPVGLNPQHRWAQVARVTVGGICGLGSGPIPSIERLRHTYRHCRIKGSDGQLREMTDPELVEQARRASLQRWIEVRFADGSEGIFSTYRLVSR